MPLANVWTYRRIDLIPLSVYSLAILYEHRVRVVHVYFLFSGILRVCPKSGRALLLCLSSRHHSVVPCGIQPPPIFQAMRRPFLTCSGLPASPTE